MAGGEDMMAESGDIASKGVALGDDTSYLPDGPISSVEEDLLGRSRFAQHLGDAILAWQSDESIVIGLYGSWGIGKTSILNMVVEHIEGETKDLPKDAKPLVVGFNPWNFSQQNQLISMFFHELSTFLGRRDESKKARNLGIKLKTYGKFFEPLGFVPYVGPWASLTAKLLKFIGRSSLQWGKLKEQDLAGLRKEINQLLREQKRHIIIIMDDIDRLNQVEISQIFQLIKLNANFPNTIYLTAFDPKVVQKALEANQAVSGKEYLEKIVQVAFDVPPVEPLRLARILFQELDRTIYSIYSTPEEHWDQKRWGNLYGAGFKMLFNSLRDVKRFINGLRFNLSLVSGEVNPVDFIGIEGIRIFAPRTYRLIVQNKELFTSTRDTSTGTDTLRKQYEQIFSEAPEYVREPMRQICKQLFPQLEYAYGGAYYDSTWQSSWRKELRVCATDVFDKYFLLEVPEGEISQVELKELLSLADDVVKFTSALRQLNEHNRISRFLERLEDFTSVIPIEHVEPICQALFDIGDELPLERRAFIDSSCDLQVARIIYQLLKRVEAEQDRVQILQTVISRTPSLYTPTYIVSFEQPDERDSGKLLVSESGFQQLKEACIRRIQEATKSKRLQKTRGLGFILYRWQEWGDASEVEQYIEGLLSSLEGFADFLDGLLVQQFSYRIGDYVGKTEWRIHLRNIESFTNLDSIRERAGRLTEEETNRLSPRQLLAIQTFRAEISKKGSGEELD